MATYYVYSLSKGHLSIDKNIVVTLLVLVVFLCDRSKQVYIKALNYTGDTEIFIINSILTYISIKEIEESHRNNQTKQFSFNLDCIGLETV